MTDKNSEVETLPWTGERYLPDVQGNIELEHLHRYLFASRLTVGKRVLDIACGEGYGSALISQSALSVIGVDIAAEAVTHAKQAYRADNLEFRIGSCAAIPLPDQCVDIVVSFETIEHHYEHEEMMREIKRVLVPGGLLIISSPDKYEYTERPGGHNNPYHVKELYRSEFQSLLNSYFKHQVIAGQRIIYGSAIFEEEGGGGKIRSYDLNDKMLVPAPGIARPLYLVAVASDGQLPKLESGLLEQPVRESDDVRDGIRQIRELHAVVGQLQQTASERDAKISQLNQDLAEHKELVARLDRASSDHRDEIELLQRTAVERDEQIAHVNRLLSERESQIADLNKLLAASVGRISGLQGELIHLGFSKEQETSHLRQQLEQITRSRSWRLTAPVRKANRVAISAIELPRAVFLSRVAEYLRRRSGIFSGTSIRQIRNSSLFDADYYLSRYPDLRAAGVDPAKHYFLHGWREKRDPSAAFSTSQYLLENPDVGQAHVNPLLHYLRFGQKEGRRIGLEKNSPEAGSISTPAVSGQDEPFRLPGPQLSQAEYPAATQVINKVDDAAIASEVEDIKKSGLFDEAFYVSMYTELQLTRDQAIGHYVERGWREGKNPSNDFDTNFYLTTYSDIRNAGINPFWHYVVSGAAESRQPLPESSTAYEDDIWFGDVHSDIKLLAYYSSPDWAVVKHGRPAFRGHTQPFFPHHSLGFYEGADAQVLKAQARMAKRHGFHGFCFDIDARRDGAAAFQPVELLLKHNDIDFSFCVQVKLGKEAVSDAFAASIVSSLADTRYIRLTGRPVLVVKVADDVQDASSVLGNFRRRLSEQSGSNPFVIVHADSAADNGAPSSMPAAYDARLDLPGTPTPGETGDFPPLDRNGVDVVPYSVVASRGIVRTGAARTSVQPLFHCVSLARDNSAGKPERALVYSRFNLLDYRRWLDAAFSNARIAHPDDRRFVFINGWNNWNDGLFLEPDRQAGYSRLNETTRALLSLAPGLKMPKVSVIVPNYNHARFLRRRLHSIYSQTYRNIEVILMDDCSSDQSRAIMDQYADAYPEVTRKLYNGTNSGSAFRQWAKGIKAATGDLVWIAESDDYCDENFLNVLVRCFDDEAVLLAYSKCVFVAGNETPLPDEFGIYVSDLKRAMKWNGSYVETAHNEVKDALGIKNTIPNASGVLFKHPVDMPLLDDESWRSMAVAGDWVFYLHLIRGGKIAYACETTNFFRRYEGSTAEITYKKEVFYREVGMASRTVAALYNVPLDVLEQCRDSFGNFYQKMVGQSSDQFALWYDYQSVLRARESRLPNVMVSTMGFFPGGAEILPIRLANEFKRQGLSVLLLSAGLSVKDDGIRRMLRNDVPLVETPEIDAVKAIIHDFGVEVLNTHQWHIQKYPLLVPDVFGELRGHVASLHGMIEHEDAFGVTKEQLHDADRSITTWVYTADKNIAPFSRVGLYSESSPRFVKIPNGMQAPVIVPISRANISIPEDAFTLCCVSRAIPDKGWAETIKVVERARILSGLDIRLILVGNGPVYDEYCQIGVPAFVYLAGFSENSVGYYATADMGIMLTKFRSESFPLTIVDCLFAGKPYIATDVGEIRNILMTDNGHAGAVIELDDWEIPVEEAATVVAAFASDRNRYKQAAELVHDVAQRYQIDNVALQYIRLFESSRNNVQLQPSGNPN